MEEVTFRKDIEKTYDSRKHELRATVFLLLALILLYIILHVAISAVSDFARRYFLTTQLGLQIILLIYPTFLLAAGYLGCKFIVLFTNGKRPEGRITRIVNISVKTVSLIYFIFMLPYCALHMKTMIGYIIFITGNAGAPYSSSFDMGEFLNNIYMFFIVLFQREILSYSLFVIMGIAIYLTGRNKKRKNETFGK